MVIHVFNIVFFSLYYYRNMANHKVALLVFIAFYSIFYFQYWIIFYQQNQAIILRKEILIFMRFLICDTETDCSYLSSPPRARKFCSNGQQPGSVCSFSCAFGYRRLGTARRRCNGLTGKWSASSPTCQRRSLTRSFLTLRTGFYNTALVQFITLLKGKPARVTCFVRPIRCRQSAMQQS